MCPPEWSNIQQLQRTTPLDGGKLGRSLDIFEQSCQNKTPFLAAAKISNCFLAFLDFDEFCLRRLAVDWSRWRNHQYLWIFCVIILAYLYLIVFVYLYICIEMYLYHLPAVDWLRWRNRRLFAVALPLIHCAVPLRRLLFCVLRYLWSPSKLCQLLYVNYYY